MTDPQRRDGAGSERNWRGQLAKAFQPTRASIQPLLKGWLLTSQNGKLSVPCVQFRTLIKWQKDFKRNSNF
jgi:hypothetical protein